MCLLAWPTLHKKKLLVLTKKEIFLYPLPILQNWVEGVPYKKSQREKVVVPKQCIFDPKLVNPKYV